MLEMTQTAEARIEKSASPSHADLKPESREQVKNVNCEQEGWSEPVLAYSEPTIVTKNGRAAIEFVGRKDESDERQSLFAEFGTPGRSLRPGLILLPTSEAEYGSPQELHRETLTFINKYCQFPEGMDVVTAYFIRLTWLFDVFPEVPYLRYRNAAYGVGKSRALEVVGSLCRRAVMISGASSSACMRRIVDLTQGTLLIDEGDFDSNSPQGQDLKKMLQTGFQRGRLICLNEPGKGGTWKPKGFEAYGPKVVAQHHRYLSGALESRFIDCVMQPKTRSIPLNLPQPDFDLEALALRNKYLSYRRDNLTKVRMDSSLASADLEDRMNQIAIPLLSIVDDPKDVQVIVYALESTQSQLRNDVSASHEGLVASAILRLSDGKQHASISSLHAELGCNSDLGPRRIGDIARKIGLRTEHRRDGNVILVDNSARRLLRTLLREDPSESASHSSHSSQGHGEPPVELHKVHLIHNDENPQRLLSDSDWADPCEAEGCLARVTA
ncbi:MAG: hypothetical protein AMXMBFR20_20320 [Planctomycetia bacterium]